MFIENIENNKSSFNNITTYLVSFPGNNRAIIDQQFPISVIEIINTEELNRIGKIHHLVFLFLDFENLSENFDKNKNTDVSNFENYYG